MDKNFDEENIDIEEEVVDEDGDVDFRAKISNLKEELKVVKKERAEYLNGWQRAKADYANVKQDSAKEREDYIKYANSSFVLELLPSLDSFDMAFMNKEAWEQTPKEWRVGVELIYNQLIKVLENHGVTQYDPEGEEFDPSLHTPIQSEEVTDKNQDNKITFVAKKGYKMKEKVLRAAEVKVGKYKDNK